MTILPFASTIAPDPFALPDEVPTVIATTELATFFATAAQSTACPSLTAALPAPPVESDSFDIEDEDGTFSQPFEIETYTPPKHKTAVKTAAMKAEENEFEDCFAAG